MDMTFEKLDAIIDEALRAAHAAADKYFQEKLGGVDQYACGFAAVRIYRYQGQPIKGSTKLGKLMKQAGIRQNWERTFEIWNPSKFPCQNVDTLEAGARAAAEVFRKHGFEAYAWSRLD